MLIIDGNYLIYRSFYGSEKAKTTYEITDDNHYIKVARNIFLKLVSKAKNQFQPNSLFIVFDSDGDNYRHRLLPTYKSNRKERPKEIGVIKKEVYSFLKEFGFAFQIAEDAEADDLIASYIEKHPDEKVMIFTGDGDLAALVNKNVTLMLEKKKTVQKVTIQNFHHHFPVPPSKFADFKALQGDKSDCVKGIDGLFKTEVLHLFMDYESIEDFLDRGTSHYLYPKISAEREKILINKFVTTMKRDCAITADFESASLKNIRLPQKIARKINW